MRKELSERDLFHAKAKAFSVNIVKLLEIDCAVQCEIQWVLCFQSVAANAFFF